MPDAPQHSPFVTPGEMIGIVIDFRCRSYAIVGTAQGNDLGSGYV
jgi:hypothetical protein